MLFSAPPSQSQVTDFDPRPLSFQTLEKGMIPFPPDKADRPPTFFPRPINLPPPPGVHSFSDFLRDERRLIDSPRQLRTEDGSPFLATSKLFQPSEEDFSDS